MLRMVDLYSKTKGLGIGAERKTFAAYPLYFLNSKSYI